MNKRDKLTAEQQKIGRLLECLLLFLALLFLSGCSRLLPVSQEMGNMALLRTFAIDQGETSPWEVTLSTGKQAKGLQGMQDPPVILQSQGETIQGACHQVDGVSDQYVFYGYIDQLLIGDQLAHSGISSILEHFARSDQLSLGTALWVTTGRAGDVVLASNQESPQPRLATLMEESNLGVAGITRKAGDVFTDIQEHNGTFIPILSLNESNILQEAGYGIFDNERFVALLSGEDSQGLELLEGHPQLYELTVENQKIALDLSDFHLKADPIFLGQKLISVDFCLSLKADFLEYPSLPNPQSQEEMIRQLETELSFLCNLTTSKLQELQCDPLGFREKISLYAPWNHHILEETWQQVYPDLQIHTSVSVEMGALERY